MKIGFCYGVRTYPPEAGGSIHGYQLVERLVARGHRLFSWYYGYDEDDRIRHFRGRQLAGFLRTIDALYVRVNWDAMTARLSLLKRVPFKHLPVVWELNGLPEEVVYQGGTRQEAEEATRRLRRLARFADAGIGVTHRIQRYLGEDLGLPRTYCIPNGSDPVLFAPRERPATRDEPLRVAWIGGTKWKWHDLDLMLQAARRLASTDANVEFTIYGSRDRLPPDPPPNVHCPGHVPYRELGKALAQADVGMILLAPQQDGRLKDASPLKLFDYMACGLAVVTQDDGQNGKVVRECNSGVFTTRDPEGVAETIRALERDRQRCRELGRNGRRAVETYYNWDRVARETEAVLQDLARDT